MTELTEQLRQYGEAAERLLLSPDAAAPIVAPRRRRRKPILAVAGVVAAAATVAAVAVVASDDKDAEVTTHRPVEGVFSSPTNVVLLTSDGIDGVTAVDLDRRLAGRRVLDGERAGDQPVRLTLTGDHLVAGWGEINAAPLTGGPSRKIDDNTIFVPASEPGEVWTFTNEGSPADGALRRVRVDGTVTFSSTGIDPDTFWPILGVPGGVAGQTPDGIAVWDAETQTLGPVLGPGRASSVTSNGQLIAWCTGSCSSTHVVPLQREGPPTARHAVPDPQTLALSPDGRSLAVLRADDASLVVRDLATGTDSAVASGLALSGTLMWTPDSAQIFYANNNYQPSSMEIGRFVVADRSWELHTIPVLGGFGPIALTRQEARSFFGTELVAPDECPPVGAVYPSGRKGVCTFGF